MAVSRDRYKPYRLIDLILIVVLVMLFIFAVKPSHAGGNCNGPGDDSCYNEIVDVDVSGGDMTGGDMIGGDISTGGNKSLALVAPGLGDVDIAQCLGSTQWSLLVYAKQKLALNQVCMAEFYLKVGRYDLAAQALCNQPEILMEYSTEVACEIQHDFTPAIVEGNDELTETFESIEESYAQQEEEIGYLQEENASIVDRLDVLTAQLEAPRAQPEPVIVQQQAEPLLSDQEKLDILGLLTYQKGDEDE